jgi:hypothetical protein
MEFGGDALVDGCIVCKLLCCCADPRGVATCGRVNHCYRRCKGQKNQQKQNQLEEVDAVAQAPRFMASSPPPHGGLSALDAQRVVAQMLCGASAPTAAVPAPPLPPSAAPLRSFPIQRSSSEASGTRYGGADGGAVLAADWSVQSGGAGVVRTLLDSASASMLAARVGVPLYAGAPEAVGVASKRGRGANVAHDGRGETAAAAASGGEGWSDESGDDRSSDEDYDGSESSRKKRPRRLPAGTSGRRRRPGGPGVGMTEGGCSVAACSELRGDRR